MTEQVPGPARRGLIAVWLVAALGIYLTVLARVAGSATSAAARR